MKKNLIIKRQFGFTLTELLVVLAVIAVVAAMLIPMVGRVRESAMSAKSVSNMRQILNAAALHQAQFGTPVYYRRPISGHGNLYFFQYFPILYWDHNFDNLHSPFKSVDWRQEDPERRTRFNLTSEITVPLPSYGMNHQRPRIFYEDEFGAPASGSRLSASLDVRPDVNRMERPESRAYFVETMGAMGVVTRPPASSVNLPRFAHQGRTAALVGFMDFSVGFVSRQDLLGEEGARWEERDRSLFWTGNSR